MDLCSVSSKCHKQQEEMEVFRISKAMVASLVTNRNLKDKQTTEELGPFQFKTKIVWFNLLGFLAMHLLGVYGIYLAIIKFFTNFEIATVLWSKYKERKGIDILLLLL